MPIDRKALRRRMQEEQDKTRENVKAQRFVLPDLRGPQGNAHVLLGGASRLLDAAGASDATKAEFHREATSGDYDKLLRTIQEWFTVAVPDVTYVDVGDDFDITSLVNRDDQGDWSQYDTEDDEEPDEELDEQLESYEANAERDRKIAEAQDRINREVREELGLDDDDVVIVQVKKRGQK